jgi:phosphoribosylanthranilate isomerase
MMVKICGIRELNDVNMIEKSDADFIGFINIERSIRYAKLKLIKELKSQMDEKNKAVMVLEPDDVDEAIGKSLETDITRLQLHSLSPKQIHSLKNKQNLHITRALGLKNDLTDRKKSEIKDFAKVCDSILFDYELDGNSGGNGIQIPLETVIDAARIVRFVSGIDIFLAGGLNSKYFLKNKNQILKNFQGVDLNSGVEKSPGVKDEIEINRFFEICR